ncbi:MAG: HPF1 family protein [Clostridiales bacterium]|nr:HPF1 family protein [Clostridiales bacterium]
MEEKVVAYQEMELEQKDISYIKQMQKELSMLRNVLVKYGTKERKARGEEYCCLYPQESRSVTAPTWEGMGICVPENTYRLSEEYLFEKNSVPFQYDKCLEEYHANKMYQWAIHCMEQGLYGNALQIGKNLWCYNEYETEAFDLLQKAYLGLGRVDYAKITSQHKLYRKRKSADITCFHEADIKR